MNHQRMADLHSLTSIRGIAAWLVVLYHVRSGMGGYTPAAVMAVLAKGYLAVDLFFMLSGFVLWLNYAESLRDRGLAAAPGFYWRRIARIWPLHAFILSGLIGFALLLLATGRHDPVNYALAELPLHVTMLQNWGFTAKLAWNHPAWSISCEFAAYLLFPLLAIAADWRKLGTPTLIAAIAALALLLWLVIDAPRLDDDISRLGLRRCLIEFTIGTLVCALWQRWRHEPLLPAMLSAAITLAATSAWAAGLGETFAVPLLFAALLALLAFTDAGPRTLLNSRALIWLGEISYATYLVHYPLFIAFKLLFVQAAADIPPAMIALFLLLVLGTSALLYRWIEKPAQRALNSLARRRQTVATV